MRYDLKKKNNLRWFIDNVGSLFPSDITLEGAWIEVIRDGLDDTLKSKYGMHEMVEVYDGDKEADDTAKLQFFREIIKTYLMDNAYKYEGLYESTQLVYNPLYNVDGTEIREVTTKHTGSVDTAGSGKITDSGSDSSTDTTAETPYDSAAYLDEAKDVSKVDYGKISDSLTTSKTINDLTDTTREVLTRQGNIGVTKSTELIADQRLILDFSFLDIVARDLLPIFCEVVYTL